jgi:hypothetical protein
VQFFLTIGLAGTVVREGLDEEEFAIFDLWTKP